MQVDPFIETAGDLNQKRDFRGSGWDTKASATHPFSLILKRTKGSIMYTRGECVSVLKFSLEGQIRNILASEAGIDNSKCMGVVVFR